MNPEDRLARIEARLTALERFIKMTAPQRSSPSPVHKPASVEPTSGVEPVPPSAFSKPLESYPMLPKGGAVIWPQQKDTPIYHNRAIWPSVTAYWLKAAAKVENIATVSKEQMKIIGDKLQAGGLWFGAVQDMSIDRWSCVASPTVILQFELVDPQTGATIWSTVVSREGLGFGSRLFGVGTESTNKVVQDLVREALNSLIQ